MSKYDHAARNGAQKSETRQDETRKNQAEIHGAPHGLGPTGAPWTYPKRCFEPDFHSPNLSLTPLSQVRTKPPAWECSGRLPRGAVTIVAGEHGSGKSLLAVDWAARITRGEPEASASALLNAVAVQVKTEADASGSPRIASGRPGEAVIAHACDLSLDSLRRRIDAAGAAPGRIASLALAYPDDDKQFTFETLRRRVISLASAVRGTANVRLLVIDNLEAWAGNYHEPPSAALLGFLLAQLTELATQAEIAIVALAQLPRAGGQAAARKLDQLTALAPVVYLAAGDPERPRRKLLLPVKNNLAPSAAASFEIADGRVVWSEAPLDASADEFIVPLSRRLEARHERESATHWLLDALAGGPIESRELFRQASDCGIAARTLRRAAQSLGLSPHKTSFRGPWQWQLGEPGANGQSAAAESGEPEASGRVSAPGAESRLSLGESRSSRGSTSNRGRASRSRAAQDGQPRGGVLAAAESGEPLETEADASGLPSARGVNGCESHGQVALTQAG